MLGKKRNQNKIASIDLQIVKENFDFKVETTIILQMNIHVLESEREKMKSYLKESSGRRKPEKVPRGRRETDL